MFRRASRDSHNERGPCARLTLQAHRSAVSLHDLFHQVQAQSGAVDLILHRFLAAEERVEHMFLFFGRDSSAVIRDANFYLPAFGGENRSRGDSDRSFARRPSVLGGVGQKILQSVPERQRIASDPRQTRLDAGLNLAQRVFQHALVGQHGLLDQSGDGHRLVFLHYASGLSAREAQDLFDDGAQTLAFLLDERAVAFHWRWIRRNLPPQIERRGSNHCERRAQLMGNTRYEFHFHLSQLLGSARKLRERRAGGQQ